MKQGEGAGEQAVSERGQWRDGDASFVRGWFEGVRDALAVLREPEVRTVADAATRILALVTPPGVPPAEPHAAQIEGLQNTLEWTSAELQRVRAETKHRDLIARIDAAIDVARVALGQSTDDAVSMRTPDGKSRLAWSSSGARHVPVLTVALRTKWYELYVVEIDGSVRALDHGFAPLSVVAERLRETPYLDHVPNPRVFEALAEENGWELDELAEELVVGRWQLEHSP